VNDPRQGNAPIASFEESGWGAACKGKEGREKGGGMGHKFANA